MKIVKTDWRSKLNESNLESLLRIKVEGPSIKGFAEKFFSKAVHLWWGEKERRVNQGKRKHIKIAHQVKQNANGSQMPILTNFLEDFMVVQVTKKLIKTLNMTFCKHFESICPVLF